MDYMLYIVNGGTEIAQILLKISSFMLNVDMNVYWVNDDRI